MTETPKSNDTFDEQLATASMAVQTCIDAVLPGVSDQPITQAMRHALSGGKRLRGFLVIESARLHGIEPEVSAWAAAAIECLHAYSLVHDDLPSMDDDDLRRGQPTVHVKWDEATAILVGDALQSLAFELLSGPLPAPDNVRVTLISNLARASGASGMVLGQAMDIQAETARGVLTLEEITELQAKKTGALIGWSCTAGALLGQSDPKPMQDYANALGLAFQIADDLLDATGDEATTGKRVGKDADAGKATFVSLLGPDGARARAHALIDEALAALEPYGTSAETLRTCARFVISRDH